MKEPETSPATAHSEAPSPKKTKRMVFDPVQLVERALDLADTIAQKAERVDLGLAWTGPRLPDGHSEYVPRMLNSYLYGGTTGVAVFFAAIAKVSGESRFADLALEILAPLRSQLDRGEGEPDLDPYSLDVHPPVGGIHGYGSILYAMARVGSILGRDDLIEEARRGIWIISPKLIRQDQRFDATFGSAGLILALVAVARIARQMDDDSARGANGADPAKANSRLLEVALSAFDHLLSHRVEAPSGHRLWSSSPHHPPLAGFSHGTAGMTMAFLRLHEQTGREDLLEVAGEALDYEKTLFDPEHGNWLDARSLDDLSDIWLTRWCHGAPGIALGRLGHPSTRHRSEVEIALETTIRKGWNGVDHLCCGIIGRAEILLTAAQDLDRDEYRSQGRRLLLQSMDRAEREGAFRWVPRTSGPLFDPSFFLGASGVGYSLLRFADESLPCIARLD